MIWRDTTIVVPSLLSSEGRADSLRDVLVQLAQQCPDAIVRVVPQWRETIRPAEVQASLSAGLRCIASRYVLWLEDDVMLCRDFGERASSAIVEHVNAEAALSLFSGVDFSPGVHALDTLVGCQAVAVPHRVVETWAAEILNLRDAKNGLWFAPEHALTLACDLRGVRLQTITPSLVQHRHLPSTFGFTVSLYSPTFED
jgi:hypothetical protein